MGFTFSLLAYICLFILLKDANESLCVPMIRLHLGDEQNRAPVEKFLGYLSKVLSHLLSEEHQANSQGIRIKSINYFKVRNSLSSLYSRLPKKFRFAGSSPITQVDKLAIIIVSSRESDWRWSGTKQKISNLMGEVVVGQCLEDGAIQLETLKTFSDNYDIRDMYEKPSVLVDEVSNLYRQGYKHFVYIAKSPYSSHLHMTQTEEDEDLFFMSRDVITSLKGEHGDIKIYPIFFDKYYVVKLAQKLVGSLYIQDTRDLASLVQDPSQQSVVFFNLFNGIDVRKDNNYNGVISYATLLNIYGDILNNEDIYMGLISKTSMKNDILNYLTLFHFSRYEKDSKINLKLDPYENLIGDESVGAFSVFKHMRGGGKFNSLAFLTEVRKVLNVQE